jgi:AmmeMemoRadiSam system protein A
MSEEEHPLVQLARMTIEEYVRHHRTIAPPKELSSEMRKKAGTFVSLHRHDALRGCIGTIGPTQPNVAQEIIRNAISAAMRDPRFSPLTADELEDLVVSVDVLTEPEPVASMKDLDPKKYGVIVESGGRRGLLLPDLEGVDTVEEQVDIARRKAWIGPREPLKLSRFQVIRYGHH